MVSSPSNIMANSALQQALFQYADKDKSGNLSTSELKTVTGAILGKSNPTSADTASVLTALDGDKSGSVSEPEFLQASIAQANNNSLLSGGTLASILSGGTDSSNPYAALTGYNSNSNISNLYSSLVSGSLSTSTQAGALTGALEYGALTAKGLLV